MRPVRERRQGRHDQKRPRHAPLQKMRQQRDRLDRLAEAHLVRQDAVDAVIMQLDEPVQAFYLIRTHGSGNSRRLSGDAVHLELRLRVLHESSVFRRFRHARAARLALLLAQVQVRILLHEVTKDLGLGHEVIQPFFSLISGAAVDAPELLELGQSFLLRAPRLGDLGLDVRRHSSNDGRDRGLRRLISGGHAGRLGHELLVVVGLLLVRVVLDAVHLDVAVVGLAAGRLGRRRRLLRRRRRFHGVCCLFCCPHACALAFHGTAHRVLFGLTLSERVAR